MNANIREINGIYLNFMANILSLGIQREIFTNHSYLMLYLKFEIFSPNLSKDLVLTGQ